MVDEGKLVRDRYCPMPESGKCAQCRPCDVMTGIGGSGLFSDGTLNLRPDIGGDLQNLIGDEGRAWGLVDEVDQIFLKHGAPEKKYGTDDKKAAQLEWAAASADVKFIRTSQRHIGTENTPLVIHSLVEHAKSLGLEVMNSKLVDDIMVEDGRCIGIITHEGERFHSNSVLLAPGRVGSSWMDELVKRHSITASFTPIDIGVRVEVPSIIMDDVIKVNHDPKFHIRTETYDDFVRTFCTNHDGWVVKENYDGKVGVNGHSRLDIKSGKTNFAFLVRVSLTEPVEDTIDYGKAIADLTTTIGGGKPILQRLSDLRRGRRTHKQHIYDHPFSPTLSDFTCGDISMALPHRVVTDILEGLERLSKVIPGVASDSTLLYAPEIKFYSMRVTVDQDMMSSIQNLYVAGDGAGLSRDIVTAAATGILAAQGIKSKCQ